MRPRLRDIDALLVVRHGDAAWPVKTIGYNACVRQRRVAGDQPPGGRMLLHQIGQPLIGRVVSGPVSHEDRSIGGNGDRRRTADRLAVNLLDPSPYFAGVTDSANPAFRNAYHEA